MIHLYSPVTAPRLEYILGVIFRDHLRVPYRLTTDRDDWMEVEGTKINYSGENLPVGLAIPPSGILSETFAPGRAPVANAMQGAGPLEGGVGATAGVGAPGSLGPGAEGGPRSGAEGSTWPFDLFGAIFYLLSRYEEYLPQAVYDPMGRFDPESSWAVRKGWLERPLVDEWIEALGQALRLDAKGGAARGKGGGAVFGPTYDIDQPWCYQHKGWKANILSAGKAVAKGQWAQFREQADVLGGRKRDPFDNFFWMDQVNEALPASPVYFFPLAAARTAFDKNPSPGNPAYQSMIRAHSAKYPVGLHPSFFSTTTPGQLASECAVLTQITGLPVTVSRFHYIRFRLPDGYRLLLDCGIRADYSMGYGERNGFRASYSRPFPWYDLEKETSTNLQVVPFCWMEATSYYNSRLNREAALAELQGYHRALDLVGGRLTAIWHNNSLGESDRWIGWRSVYSDFLRPFVPTLPT